MRTRSQYLPVGILIDGLIVCLGQYVMHVECKYFISTVLCIGTRLSYVSFIDKVQDSEILDIHFAHLLLTYKV
jgi:hypothetical protein